MCGRTGIDCRFDVSPFLAEADAEPHLSCGNSRQPGIL